MAVNVAKDFNFESTIAMRPAHALDGVERCYVVVEAPSDHTSWMVDIWKANYLSLWQHMWLHESLMRAPWNGDGFVNCDYQEAACTMEPNKTTEETRDWEDTSESQDPASWTDQKPKRKQRNCSTPSAERLTGHRFFSQGMDPHADKKETEATPSEDSGAGGSNKSNPYAGRGHKVSSKHRGKRTDPGDSDKDFSEALQEHEQAMQSGSIERQMLPVVDVKLTNKAFKRSGRHDVVIYNKHMNLLQLKVGQSSSVESVTLPSRLVHGTPDSSHHHKEETKPEDETKADASRQCCGIKELRSIGTGSSACPRLRVNVSALARSQWYSAEEACTLLDMFSEWLDRAFIIQEYQGMLFGLRPDGDAFTAFWHFMREHRKKDGLCKRLSTPYHTADRVYVPEQTAGWFKLQPDVQQLITALHDEVAAEQPPLDHSKWMDYRVPENTCSDQDDFSCNSGDHSQDSDSAMEDYLEQMGVDVRTTDPRSTPVTDHKGKGNGKFKSRPPGSERALQPS